MKTKAQFLASNGGSHEAAFEALYTDYAASVNANAELQQDTEKNSGETLRAQIVRKELERLAEALGIELPEKGRKPTREASEALTESVSQAIEALGEEGGINPAEAAQYQAHAELFAGILQDFGLDPDKMVGDLSNLPEDATDEQWESTLQAHLAPVITLQKDATEGRLMQIAEALKKDKDALREVPGIDRAEKRSVKAQDGTESETWVIPGEGDTFRPLAEIRLVQLLPETTAPAQQPRPTLPTTQKGGPVQPKSDADMRREKAENISHMI